MLATSDKLLMRTVNNINGEKPKDRLIDEPSFAALSDKFPTHIAAVWINQTALNADYYFKCYWLMSDVEKLDDIRAGMFDFEVQEKKIIERRRFLLAEAEKVSTIDVSQIARMLAFVPPSVPFYKLQTANDQKTAVAVSEIIGERSTVSETTDKRRENYYFYDEYDDYSASNYENPGEGFDQMIDETDEDETIIERETNVDFSKSLQTARPQAILNLTDARVLPAPRFVEFRRGAIFHLAAPENFNAKSFEAAIERSLSSQTMIHAPDVHLSWETVSENGTTRREFRLPMLAFQIGYAIIGSELILTNDADFLREITQTRNPPEAANDNNNGFSGLTVINLDQRENAYDKVFARLSRKTAAEFFFTRNVASLLDSIADAARIEIKDNFSNEFYEQEITLTFK